MPRFDLHTHILPGVDDGSPDLHTSLQMLEAEAAQGVGTVFLTPHFRKGENDVGKIRSAYEELKKAAVDAGLSLKLILGGEIYYNSSVVEQLLAGEILTLGGSSYVLVEFIPDAPFFYLEQGLMELLAAGYDPILAHAERYRCLWNHGEKLKELVEKGVYIQINGASFWKHPKKKELLQLARDGYVHLIGTDCHRMDWRPVNVKETFDFLAERLEKEDFCRIFFENPKELAAEIDRI